MARVLTDRFPRSALVTGDSSFAVVSRRRSVWPRGTDIAERHVLRDPAGPPAAVAEQILGRLAEGDLRYAL